MDMACHTQEDHTWWGWNLPEREVGVSEVILIRSRESVKTPGQELARRSFRIDTSDTAVKI